MATLEPLWAWGTAIAQLHKPMKKSRFNTGMMGVAIAMALSLSSCIPQPKPAQPAPEAATPSQSPATPGEQAANSAVDENQSAAGASAPPPKATPSSPKPPILAVKPPASEVVPADAKSAAATITDTPLPLTVQSYSSDELFAAGSGGCGMSLWRAEGQYNDSLVLFNGIGEGPQLLMKLDSQFVTFERIEGSGEEFYGQFAQQRFRNLAGSVEVVTEVQLGAEGEIESVAIDGGRVVVTRDGVSQEIAVKGDAGC